MGEEVVFNAGDELNDLPPAAANFSGSSPPPQYLYTPTSLVWTGAQEQQISRSLPENLLIPETSSCRMADTDVAPAGGYQFPMVRYTDMDEDMKKEVSLSFFNVFDNV